MVFMGCGFTSGGQESGSVFSAAMCKIQASKRYIEPLPLVLKGVILHVPNTSSLRHVSYVLYVVQYYIVMLVGGLKAVQCTTVVSSAL